jgi:hypothetical protein
MSQLGDRLRADVQAHASKEAAVTAFSRHPPTAVRPRLDALAGWVDAFRDVVVPLLVENQN